MRRAVWEPWPCSAKNTAMWYAWCGRGMSPWSSVVEPMWTIRPSWGCSISCRNPLSPPACGGSRRSPGATSWIGSAGTRLCWRRRRNLKAGQQEEVPEKAAQLTAELKAVQKELEALKAGIAAQKVEELLKTASKEVEGLQIVWASSPGTGGDAVRGMCDRARDAATRFVVVLAGIQEDKGSVSFGCLLRPGGGPAWRQGRRCCP